MPAFIQFQFQTVNGGLEASGFLIRLAISRLNAENGEHDEKENKFHVAAGRPVHKDLACPDEGERWGEEGEEDFLENNDQP